MEPVVVDYPLGDNPPQSRLYYGLDVREGLKLLLDQSVQMVATSPPYWGLRSYNVEGQIGLEQQPQEYVESLVEVFREVRRVLRDDGVVWLNLGDSYASARAGHTLEPHAGIVPESRRGEAAYGEFRKAKGGGPRDALSIGLKHKDLVGIPWMVAFALRTDGWYLRSDVIWAKNAIMPESVRDRPTKSHEYVFLLTKRERYFYDQDAIKEPHKYNRWSDRKVEDAAVLAAQYGGQAGKTSLLRGGATGFHPAGGRNKRTVWTVNPKPYKGAHFATWPEALVEPMVLAGSAEGDMVLDPFSGSATTGAVAMRLGRNYIGIDLNAEYLDLAVARLQGRAAPEKVEEDDDADVLEFLT